MSNRTKVPRAFKKPFQSESKAEYAAEERKYFGAMGDASGRGLSAADAAMADRYLPSKEQEHKMLEFWEIGLTKASRSGAFSKPGSGPMILPNGRKHWERLMQMTTPGQYQQQVERPVLKEQTRNVDVPRAAVTITSFCIDCLKPVNENDASTIIPSLFIIHEKEQSRLFAMGVAFGDIVLMIEHKTCAREAAAQERNSAPLVLVREGEVSDPRDMEIAAKYGFIHRMHSGHEISMGAWYAAKRKERLEKQFQDVLIAMDKTSTCYRKNRPELQ